MQERQVTIGGEPFPLDKPFLVMATQNPIEQEGTYPLPEAQVDRFMLKVVIDYPKNVQMGEYKEGEPFSFTCEVDVLPEVTLGKYKGLYT